MYKHEEDKPGQPKLGKKPQNDAGAKDFKSQASDQAYGQAGMKGCNADQAKIQAQYFSGAYTDDTSGY